MKCKECGLKLYGKVCLFCGADNGPFAFYDNDCLWCEEPIAECVECENRINHINSLKGWIHAMDVILHRIDPERTPIFSCKNCQEEINDIRQSIVSYTEIAQDQIKKIMGGENDDTR